MNKRPPQSLLFLLIFLSSAPAFAQAPPPDTWVQHVIIIVQENRSTDNLFQDANLYNSGADILLQTGTANAACSTAPGGFLALTGEPLNFCANPDHDHDVGFEQSFDFKNNTWDNACNVQADHENCAGHRVHDTDNYTYVQNTVLSNGYGVLDPYFEIAENYGFANYMFQTNQGASYLAHQFLFSGTSQPVDYPTTYYNLYAAEEAQGGNSLADQFLFSRTSQTVDYPARDYDWYAARKASGLNGHAAGCAAPNGTYALDLDSTYNMAPPPWQKEYPTFTPLNQDPTKYAGFPCYTHASMADLLDGAGVSWKYYIQSNTQDNDTWNAPNSLTSICPFNPATGAPGSGVCSSAEWTAHIADMPGDILNDIATCNVPQVSWVIPDGLWSDHPGVDTNGVGSTGGPSWVAAIVNAVGNSPAHCLGQKGGFANWSNTVIFVTWDDWGGFFDHIAPYLSLSSPTGMEGGYEFATGAAADDGKWYVYGFRVPMLVVSQYTQNYISGLTNASHQTVNEKPPYVHDFGSILGFIEKAFSLPPYNNSQNTCGIAGASDPVNGCQYPFADYYAPDGPFECSQTGVSCNNGAQAYPGYPLFDFFNLSTPRAFMNIPSAYYPPDCFTNPTQKGCFPSFPTYPDDE